MRKLIIIIALCSLCNCTSQTKKEDTPKKEVIKTIKKDTTKHKTHTMEHFNIKDYENLKKDSEFGNSEDNTLYILDDKRIRVSFYLDKGIRVDETSKINPIKTIKGFSQKTTSIRISYFRVLRKTFQIWDSSGETKIPINQLLNKL